MLTTLKEYLKDGMTLTKNGSGGYTVFTVPTQHFGIDSLDELTLENFQSAYKNHLQNERISRKLWGETIGKQMTDEIDKEILKQLGASFTE